MTFLKVLIIYLIQYFKMLGNELNVPNKMEISKSSFYQQQVDEKKLREMVEERDKTIRKLSKKIEKLQVKLKNAGTTLGAGEYDNDESIQKNNYFNMLKAEMSKSKQLEDIIKDMVIRVNSMSSDIAQDSSFTDNSQCLREMVKELEIHQSHLSISEDIENDPDNSFNISQEWMKSVDILEGAIKSFKTKCLGYKQMCISSTVKLEQANKIISELTEKLKQNEQIKFLKSELKEERKQREKLRGLLDKTEFEKNQLINKINATGAKEVEINSKNKDELLQYSKELNYRIKDLEKEKQDILKEKTKDKETQLQKYQDVLKKLRIIKDSSRLGKSFA